MLAMAQRATGGCIYLRWKIPWTIPGGLAMKTTLSKARRQVMTAFEPKNPSYEERVRDSFARQAAMRTLGVKIVALRPGEIELTMDHDAAYTQQNGFVHAGIIAAALDSACGYAAFTLFPTDADVLTVELKLNLLAPARGESFVFRAQVVKPGRTLTFCEGRAFARDARNGGQEKLIATMSGTMMARVERTGIQQV
jgi:uncharacterized protein (TIGR00369 family)